MPCNDRPTNAVQNINITSGKNYLQYAPQTISVRHMNYRYNPRAFNFKQIDSAN